MTRVHEKLRSFRQLPAFRLERLAAIVARHHELRHQRRFGLRSGECRVVGIVGAQQPISLRRLCDELDLDKSHGSRLVSRLVGAGLLERRDDPVDQRSFYLVLTVAGTAMHAQIHDDAVERNDEWLAGLPEERRAAFMECVDMLAAHSQKLLAFEAAGADGAPRAAPRDPAAAPEGNPLLLIERTRLESLHRQLGALLEPRASQAETARRTSDTTEK